MVARYDFLSDASSKFFFGHLGTHSIKVLYRKSNQNSVSTSVGVLFPSDTLMIMES
jgi:hypothetical protein